MKHSSAWNVFKLFMTFNYFHSITVCYGMNKCLLWNVQTLKKLKKYQNSLTKIQVLRCVKIVLGVQWFKAEIFSLSCMGIMKPLWWTFAKWKNFFQCFFSWFICFSLLFCAYERNVCLLLKTMIWLSPPASEGWGKVLFSVCQSILMVGYPISGLGRGVPITGLAGGIPHPRSGQGCTPSQVWLGGYPIAGLAEGYPIPSLARRVPHEMEYLPRPRMGYPTRSRMGTPLDLDLGWGTPKTCDRVQTWDGVPPWTWDGYTPWTWDGVPLPIWDVVPPRIASTCYSYAAGGMPLAFMQEDFLVMVKIDD